MKLEKKIKNLYERIQGLFVKGLLATLPVILTIIIVTLFYRFLANWLKFIHRIEPKVFQKIPGSEFVIAILVLILIGIASKLLIINPILHYFEKIINKIPLVSNVYSSAKKLVDFFNIPAEKNIKRQVVLVPFPTSSYYNIGFVLGSVSDPLSKQINEKLDSKEEYVRVFMPTSPSPATGFFFMIPKSVLIYTNISFEEAIKAIVSCGLIQPETTAMHNNEDIDKDQEIR